MPQCNIRKPAELLHASRKGFLRKWPSAYGRLCVCWVKCHIHLKAVQTAGTIQLDLPTHTFKLLNESSDFLEHALLFGQVLRIKRAHLGQNGIELSAIVTGEFLFQFVWFGRRRYSDCLLSPMRASLWSIEAFDSLGQCRRIAHLSLIGRKLSDNLFRPTLWLNRMSCAKKNSSQRQGLSRNVCKFSALSWLILDR